MTYGIDWNKSFAIDAMQTIFKNLSTKNEYIARDVNQVYSRYQPKVTLKRKFDLENLDLQSILTSTANLLASATTILL